MTDRHEELRLLLGAYVLGGLGTGDRRDLEDHLSRCETCREELSRSAPLPGLLRRLPAGSAPWDDGAPSTPPGEGLEGLLPRLLDGVGQDRRRRRRSSMVRTGVIAATVAALAAVGTAAVRETPAPASIVSLSATGLSEADGDVSLVDMPWGTALTVRVSGLPDGGPFVLEVTRSGGGAPEQAASWSATPAREIEVRGASSIPYTEIDTISVVGPEGQVLASR